MKNIFYYFLSLLILCEAIFLMRQSGFEIKDIVNTLVLIITALAVAWQSWETRKLAENQKIPAVDVNMLYDVVVGKTYFWFYNASDVPANIFLKVKTKEGTKQISNLHLRIPPKKDFRHTNVTYVKRTNIHYDIEKTQIELRVKVTSAFEGVSSKEIFIKNYRFENNQWLENSWGTPDDPDPYSFNGHGTSVKLFKSSYSCVLKS